MEPSKLVALFVFNPQLGGEMTEGKKILYFYPRTPLNVQKQYVGVSEGMIQFCSDFSGEDPLHTVRSQKHRYSFLRCEPNYWMVLVVSNPVKLSKNRKVVEETRDDLVDEAVLQSILSRCYETFKLFNGGFQYLADSVGDPEAGVDFVRRKLKLFMKFMIPTMPAHLSPTSIDIDGFQFLPASKSTFLTIQYLINLIDSSFPSVHSVSIMYNDKLIWSGLPQSDMLQLSKLQNELRSMFAYFAMNSELKVRIHSEIDAEVEASPRRENDVSQPLSPATSAPPPSRESPESQQQRQMLSRNLAPGYLTGPRCRFHSDEGLEGSQFPVSKHSPRIFLTEYHNPLCKKDGNCTSTCIPADVPMRLVVYENDGLMLFLVVRADQDVAGSEEEEGPEEKEESKGPVRDPSEAFYTQLESFISKNVNKLAGMLREHLSHVPDGQDNFSVLYFNHMNLAFKPSLRCSPAKLVETMKLVRLIHADFAATGKDGPTEVFVKTKQDGWVVGRRAKECRREFFMIVEDKATLGEVQQEVERLEKELFGKIFIH